MLLCPLPAAAEGLQDFLLLDASIANTRKRIAQTPVMWLIHACRGCLNATGATSGYWVPRRPQGLSAVPFQEALRWQELEMMLARQRTDRVPDLCRKMARLDGALADPDMSIWGRTHEEYGYMSALGSSHLEDPQRLALGIIFSTEVGAEVYGLVSGGPAERAGLQQGDQLIAVAGEEVFSAAGVVLQLADAVAGQPVMVIWLRRLADGQLLQGFSQMVPLPRKTFFPKMD